MEHWNWAQWTYTVLFATGIIISMKNHGKERRPWDFRRNVVASLLVFTLLYFGGFWK